MRSLRRFGVKGFVLGLVIMSSWLGTGGRVEASTELRSALREMAESLKKLLSGRGEADIAIGQFTGPANLPTSAGPSMVQILTEELVKQGINVKARAKFGLRGEYRLTEKMASDDLAARRGKKVLALKIKAVVEDVFGNPLTDFQFERDIEGEATVLTTLGLPARLPPNGTELERDEKLRERLFDPKTSIVGTVIRSDPKSPYGIEVLVEGKAFAVQEKDGLAFVAIQRNETYSVRLINDSNLEAAVQLRIDGIGMFAFTEFRHKTGEPLYTAVIVPPKKHVVIQGWHVNNEKTDRFLVTEYAKSAAATLDSTAKVGTITATFQASWKEDEQAPKDEPGKRRGGQGDATGRGPRIDVNYEEVKRNLGVIRDSVSVRYTRPN